jgi:hypothetical protein
VQALEQGRRAPAAARGAAVGTGAGRDDPRLRAVLRALRAGPVAGHAHALLALPYAAELHARFEAQARESIAKQEAIEAGDTMPFEQYRQQYLAPERLGR